MENKTALLRSSLILAYANYANVNPYTLLTLRIGKQYCLKSEAKPHVCFMQFRCMTFSARGSQTF